MDPVKFVILWLAVGVIGNILIIFLDWLNGYDLHLKDITWCVLISPMGFFVYYYRTTNPYFRNWYSYFFLGFTSACWEAE